MTTTRTETTVYTDHLGNTYDSLEAMCDTYNISVEEYLKRIQKHWTLEDALTYIGRGGHSPRRGKICKDHLGNEFSSQKKMCAAYNMSYSEYYGRIHVFGWSLEETLLLDHNRICNDITVGELAFVHGITGVRNYFCHCNKCGHDDIYDFSEIQSHHCENA